MASTDNPTPSLKITLRDQRTYEELFAMSAKLGVLVDDLIERAILHELAALQPGLEGQLSRSLKRLQMAPRRDWERAVQEISRAEVEEVDPLRARRVDLEDLYGVGAAFDDRVG